ncbi:MAG: RNA-processing protein [Candidatus Diapherotrites archaeon]|nr:RNA-processing protein [Candidatus Diapherotrites archaeon]
MEKREILRKKLLHRAQKKIEEKFAQKEIHIIKAVNLLEDLDSAYNLLNEALSDWKSKNPAEKSLAQVSELEKSANALKEERKNLQIFIDEAMKEELPNFGAIAGAIIGAKMLSEAGSKKELAFMPSSTIQLLGARKALFNHLKGKGKCPKHGFLFSHPLVQKLPKEKRGKAARIIAGKLSIAARKDYFTGKEDSKESLKEIAEKLARI